MTAIDRRAFVAGLATVAAAGMAGALPAGVVALPDARDSAVALHRALAPVLPAPLTGGGREWWDTFRIMKAATWHYQSITDSRHFWHGVIRHLPTGFTFWTFLAPKTHWDGPNEMLGARPLFSEGEQLPADLAAHTAIAHAAAYAALLAETGDDECSYLTPAWYHHDADAEAAPPLIADVSRRPTLWVYPHDRV